MTTQILPHTPADAQLLARWAIQADTGADVFTVAELDRLIALTPAADTRALAELADCRAIEVELLGYDPTADALDADDYAICYACNGSGEGAYDGATCRTCGGSGERFDGPYYDGPDSMDGDDLVAYLAGSFAAAVAL